jgi:MoaA/NifB/PqqE/SkfB family radical SAM enzyme
VEAGENETAGVLSTDEALAVIDQIRDVGTPIVVLSGGEPLMRTDLCTIARYGTERGLRMVMGTSGYFLDRSNAERLRDAGIRTVAVSVDSADPALHDSFRGVRGAWKKAVQGIRNCRDVGIGVQINMTVMRPSAGDVQSVVELRKGLGVTDYQVFFPVPTGRAQDFGPLDPKENEEVIRQVLLKYRDSSVNLRPTCAPTVPADCRRPWDRQPGLGAGLRRRDPLLPYLCGRGCHTLSLPSGECRECPKDPDSQDLVSLTGILRTPRPGPIDREMRSV